MCRDDVSDSFVLFSVQLCGNLLCGAVRSDMVHIGDAPICLVDHFQLIFRKQHFSNSIPSPLAIHCASLHSPLITHSSSSSVRGTCAQKAALTTWTITTSSLQVTFIIHSLNCSLAHSLTHAYVPHHYSFIHALSLLHPFIHHPSISTHTHTFHALR